MNLEYEYLDHFFLSPGAILSKVPCYGKAKAFKSLLTPLSERGFPLCSHPWTKGVLKLQKQEKKLDLSSLIFKSTKISLDSNTETLKIHFQSNDIYKEIT
uniref:Uncharacterized protein n=1 Tax=Lepeophtheirus salmonis TaxID=72036 RepID=A0A0K2TKQ6_LEPSM